MQEFEIVKLQKNSKFLMMNYKMYCPFFLLFFIKGRERTVYFQLIFQVKQDRFAPKKSKFELNMVLLGLQCDQAESHDLKSQYLLFILLYFFPLFQVRREKGKRIAKVVILSHAFLIDPSVLLLSSQNSPQIEPLEGTDMATF